MNTYNVIGGNGRQYGPISADELRQWLAEGRLNAQSLVQYAGDSSWRALATYPEFAATTGGPVIPPPLIENHGETYTEQILNRDPELRLGDCLSAGFSFFAANLGFVVGAVFLTVAINFGVALIPILGGILHLVTAGVLTGGLYWATVRRMRREAVGIGNIFDGFKTNFVQLMLAGAISGLLMQFGLLLCLLPGLYLLVAWIFALPLVADKRLEFWSAMELSRKVVTRIWFQVLLLLALVYLPFLAAQAVAGIKMGTFLYGTFRDAGFDGLTWLKSIQEHTGTIFKLSLTWGFITAAAMLVSQFFAVGALMRAYENLFAHPRR